MKKILLVFMLSLALILCFTACSSGDTSSTDNESESMAETEEETLPELPVSDVSDGEGLQGTWRVTETVDETEEVVQLALNSDDTFALYTEADSNTDNNVATSVQGTYTYTDTELVLTPDEQVEGQDPGIFKTENDGSMKLTYKVDATTLSLTDSEGTVENLERV